MADSQIDPSTLSAFENAAAGHDGVLSDPTGALVIKPCTAAEIAFYESVTASHPRLAAYMPTFMGTLQLNSSPEVAAAVAAVTTSTPDDPSTPAVPAMPEAGALGAPTATTMAASGREAAAGTAAALALDDPGPLKGRKLVTDSSIVLENVAAGFKRPNILDLKLGARLYADGTAPAKRARLDKVAAETTSSSLGFRIAGMRVWQGPLGGKSAAEQKKTSDELALLDPASNYKTYNKLYGRTFGAADVVDGFKEFLVVPGAGIDAAAARANVALFLRDVRGVLAVLESLESRMYSASLLFVYEGDAAAAKDAAAAAAATVLAEKAAREAAAEDDIQTATSTGATAWNEEDDDEIEVELDGADTEFGEEDPPKVVSVKLIDFAHASWTPGQGPDENLLRGVRSIVSILEELERELAGQA